MPVAWHPDDRSRVAATRTMASQRRVGDLDLEREEEFDIIASHLDFCNHDSSQTFQEIGGFVGIIFWITDGDPEIKTVL